MEKYIISDNKIKAIGFENKTIEVELRSGEVYQYLEVEKDDFVDLITSAIPSQYLNHVGDKYKSIQVN